ncbi:MAG TPA: SDR family NAD(P)-dependent oxidoreductase [Kofleriaceae bacterium]
MTRVALVTGSTDGIGKATARALAAGGMKVLLHGRSKVKVDKAIEWLLGELPGAQVEGVAFDLGNLTAVRKGAEQILARVPELHVLVNNAGIFATERVLTEDGIELTLAVNHVGPFLLTELLAPRLIASAATAASRVVNVASVAGTRGRLHLQDLTLANGYTGYAAYARSKLANIMHAMSLAEHHDPEKLVGYSLHPGVVGTKLLREGFGPVQGMKVDAGAKASVRLAAEEVLTAKPGAFFNDGVEQQAPQAARDAGERAQLWDTTKRLAKL